MCIKSVTILSYYPMYSGHFMPTTFEHFITHWLSNDRIDNLIVGLILFISGWFIARALSKLVAKLLKEHTGIYQQTLWRKATYYIVLFIFILSGLKEAGFNLSILLGAAGVFSVAIGIASQTSASNLISGLFLIGEHAFFIGDVIKIGNNEGEVLSIDLLSIKLRTAENLYVRIPNELLIKSDVTNLTRFSTRKLVMSFTVHYDSKISDVKKIILSNIQQNKNCLNEPPYAVVLKEFGHNGLIFQASTWVKRDFFEITRDQLQEAIKRDFDSASIKPHQPSVLTK